MRFFNKGLLVVLGFICSQLAFAAGSSDEVKSLLSKSFDKPNKPLVTELVTVEGDYAIADWLQGSMGGRALLVKESGAWKVLVCGGSALTELSNLKAARVPEKTAITLLSHLVQQEKSMTSDKLILINAFKERKH